MPDGDIPLPNNFTNLLNGTTSANSSYFPLIIALIVLVFFSAFTSLAETSFSCASRLKLRALSSNGNNRAKRVLSLAEEKFDKLISTILIGNNIVNITSATIADRKSVVRERVLDLV